MPDFGLKLSPDLDNLAELIYSRDSAAIFDSYDPVLRKERGGRRWPRGQKEKRAAFFSFLARLDKLGLRYLAILLIALASFSAPIQAQPSGDPIATAQAADQAADRLQSQAQAARATAEASRLQATRQIEQALATATAQAQIATATAAGATAEAQATLWTLEVQATERALQAQSTRSALAAESTRQAQAQRATSAAVQAQRDRLGTELDRADLEQRRAVQRLLQVGTWAALAGGIVTGVIVLRRYRVEQPAPVEDDVIEGEFIEHAVGPVPGQVLLPARAQNGRVRLRVAERTVEFVEKS